MSLWNCISQPLRVGPPSTRSSMWSMPASFCISSTMSAIWYAMQARPARTTSLRPVVRLMPMMAALTSLRQ